MTTSLSYLWRSLRIDRQIEDEVTAWGGGDVTEESKNEIRSSGLVHDLQSISGLLSSYPDPQERRLGPANQPIGTVPETPQ